MRTDTNGKIVKREDSEPALVTMLAKMAPAIMAALPRHITPDRMSRMALTALRSTPKLLDCTPSTFLGSVMQAAQLGLEPNTPLGQCYLIPRLNRKAAGGAKMECTLQIGYQGLMDLVRRSGLVRRIEGAVVRTGDTFEVRRGSESSLLHIESAAQNRHELPITHAYSLAWMVGDDKPVFVVLTRQEVDSRKARGAGGPAWTTDYEAMALKTALRVLCWRWLPKSAEVARAVALDERPEMGRSQASAWDSAVTDALTSQGHDVSAEPEVEVDDGAVVPAAREPGED